MLVFEFCAENLTYIDKAIAAGAGKPPRKAVSARAYGTA